MKESTFHLPGAVFSTFVINYRVLADDLRARRTLSAFETRTDPDPLHAKTSTTFDKNSGFTDLASTSAEHTGLVQSEIGYFLRISGESRQPPSKASTTKWLRSCRGREAGMAVGKLG
ncbi:hypothetical protein V5799_024510 [Amblyomma americanum]|uniref:Uncharacterized protein n=1 Tax=Amblyomma americanum TaxID=6943 RepID=A0AAQ4EBX5_AMBAM